jgi:hypothetical protein
MCPDDSLYAGLRDDGFQVSAGEPEMLAEKATWHPPLRGTPPQPRFGYLQHHRGLRWCE